MTFEAIWHNSNLKPLKIKKNIDDLRVGEQVIAIGNPQGLGKSFSMGIVSAINRQFKNVNGSFIQTDASINPGNSGGALIDSEGNLIGITNLFLFQYYCEQCWANIHSRPGREFHKPLVKEGADRPRTVPFRWC